MTKKILVVGLGLIGGSIVKAIKSNTSHTVMGYDIDSMVCKLALREGSIDRIAAAADISKADIIILCLYPRESIEFVRNNLGKITKGTIVTDCVGTKRTITQQLEKTLIDSGNHFVGGHPMAGTEKSGYTNSSAEITRGATMILCPTEQTSPSALTTVHRLYTSMGFGKVTITSPSKHDSVIAFTSQLAHVVSSAYVQSDTALSRLGFSAGSYSDLTRVAYLNEQMWTELFIDNKDNLTHEIKTLIDRLGEFANAIENSDKKKLYALLHKGKTAKKNLG